MPLGLDSIVQQKTGSFSAASASVTLDTATTAGNHVILCAMSASNGSADAVLGPPSGFSWASEELLGASNFVTPYVFYKATAGGETSWTLAFAGGGPDQVCWVTLEVAGLDQAGPVHVASPITPFAEELVTTQSTGTAPAASSYDVLVLAIHPATGTTSAIPVWSGHTNGFAELAQPGRTSGSIGVSVSVSAKSSQALAEHECTASLDAAAYSRSVLVAFTAEGARHAVNVDTMTGFEFGTATNMTNTSIAAGEATPIFNTVVGTPAVTTSTPRTGTYALELTSTAAAECVTWDNPGVLSMLGPYGPGGTDPTVWQGPQVGRFHVYFPTSLPGVDVELASIEAGSLANGGVFWYRTATQKIGLKLGTGTEIASDTTVVANKWIGIDFRYDARVTNHLCDWQVTYDATVGASTDPVVQTQAVGASTSIAKLSKFRLGWTTSKTATVRYDDVVLSKVGNNYPIGDIQIQVVKVDPAGTPSVSGSTANFGVMTANGTIGAWNATNARNAVDDVPPTIGASADGVVQVTLASTEYMKLPMDTVQAAPDNILRALRWYWAGWAASGSVATVGMRAFDGTSELTLHSAVDHGFDASTTVIVWLSRMHRALGQSLHYLLTQARLDAMEARVGFSTDATPDAGIQTVFAELAIQPAQVINVINIEDLFTVDVRMDSVSSGVASYLVTTPPGTRGATAFFTIDGVDTSQYVAANSTYEQVIGATSIEEVTQVGLVADPE